VREDLSWRWTHSIIPFDWGWKAVVWMWEIRRRKDKEFQREEMNWVLDASVRGEGVWNTEMGNPEVND
jgi:hypothetical protein